MLRLLETPDPLFDEPMPDEDMDVALLTDEQLERFAQWMDDQNIPPREHSRPNLHVIVGNTFDGIILDDV